MAWKCIGDNCSIKLYVFSDDLLTLVKNILDFLFNVSPSVYFMLIILSVGFIIFYLFLTIRYQINR